LCSRATSGARCNESMAGERAHSRRCPRGGNGEIGERPFLFYLHLSHRHSLRRHRPSRGVQRIRPPSVPSVLIASPPGALRHLRGARNRTMLLTLADSVLLASEALHLLVEDWRRADRSLLVRGGRGRKGRVAFVGATATRALKAWLARHPAASSEAFLFCDRAGQPLKAAVPGADSSPAECQGWAAAVPSSSPHALRHFAATSLLHGGPSSTRCDGFLVTRSPTTTLRYSNLVGADLRRAHRGAGVIERMRLDARYKALGRDFA
jgi:integrase